MKKPFKWLAILILSFLFVSACNNEKRDEFSAKNSPENKEKVELLISAAASLKDAMDEIKQDYEKEHPEITLKFNYGSSGSLQQQISQGAPVDLFFSAAEDKFALLVEDGIIAEEDGMDLLGNELVLIVPKKEGAIKTFEDLEKAKVEKISIGTPETVPAGAYAKESLDNMGIWKNVEEKIVYAKDVRQVLSYVETGNVDAGIVYQTDALISNKVEIVATANPSTHAPIIYPVGIIKESKHYEAAKQFYEYLKKEHALKVFEAYGFTIQ